ncbi:MAG TPA: COX15/CtaA family protein [Jatrophihabitantaceae bacterium]
MTTARTTRPGQSAPVPPSPTPVRWLPARVQTLGWLRGLAVASVAVNVLIVVTGGAVRLTDSGLGCPTWPKCTDASLTPTKQYAIHGLIEFGNRQLTFVLAVVAVATWLVAMALRRERALATVAALGIPAQAVLGGLTVLTHLNPWLVALHFLLSMAIIAVTFVLWWRLRAAPPRDAVPAPAALLAWATLAVTAVTLVLGTIVTGSGPHAGDADASGKVHRTGLQVSSMAQLHADAVMVLVGLTVGLLALVYALRAPAAVRGTVAVLLGVEAAQAVIGYTQYFLHVPPLLVALHMLGACVVWLAALRVVLTVRARPVTTAG